MTSSYVMYPIFHMVVFPLPLLQSPKEDKQQQCSSCYTWDLKQPVSLCKLVVFLSFPASTLLCSLRQDTCPLGLALGLTIVKAMDQKPQTYGCLQDLPVWGSSFLWSEICRYPLPTLAAQKLIFILSGARLSFPSGVTHRSFFVGCWVLPVLCSSESSFSQVREIF